MSTEAPSQTHAGTWTLAPSSPTTVTVATKHMFGTGTVKATLTIASVEASVPGGLDRSRPASDVSISVVLDATSFDSANARRDEKVRDAKLLDVSTYPTITYAAAVARPVAGSSTGWTLDGTLTVHGHSQAVTLPVELVDLGTDLVQVTGSLTVVRKDFGITGMSGMIGAKTTLALDVQLRRTA